MPPRVVRILSMTLELAVKKPNWLSRLANPGHFLAWSGALLLPLGGLTAVCFAVGLYLALFASPADYQMGETVRIMYIHVPNAWLSEFVYAVMAVASIGTLVWRHPLADVAAKSAAPLGAVFTGMALFSGSLWGRPTWGTFWEWDGRMTSTLVLFLIYLGIIALWRAFEDQGRAGAHHCGVHAGRRARHPGGQILGRLVEHAAPAGEHQPDGRRAYAASILTPLLVMTLAFTLLFLNLHIVRMRTEIFRRRAETLERACRRKPCRSDGLRPACRFIIWAYGGVGLSARCCSSASQFSTRAASATGSGRSMRAASAAVRRGRLREASRAFCLAAHRA